jgi:2-amino-4-hydroxy-6-hydroxymethyldihydropteridine diphosphokinase
LRERSNPAGNQVLIGCGSNIEPEYHLSQAVRLLATQATILKLSFIYQSPAVGSTGPDYLNSAVLIKTAMSLPDLKKGVLAFIEDQLNRVRSSNKYMDRTIDLDVLTFNQTVIDPEIWTRAHIAVPAADILPDFINPDTGEKISQAAKRLLPGSNLEIRSDLS